MMSKIFIERSLTPIAQSVAREVNSSWVLVVIEVDRFDLRIFLEMLVFIGLTSRKRASA